MVQISQKEFARAMEHYAAKRPDKVDLRPEVSRAGFWPRFLVNYVGGEQGGNVAAMAGVALSESYAVYEKFPGLYRVAELLREKMYDTFKDTYGEEFLTRAQKKFGLSPEEWEHADEDTRKKVEKARDRMIFFETDGKARLLIMYATGSFMGNPAGRSMLEQFMQSRGQGETTPMDEILLSKALTMVGTFIAVDQARKKWPGFFDWLDTKIGIFTSEYILKPIKNFFGQNVEHGVDASELEISMELTNMAEEEFVSLQQHDKTTAKSLILPGIDDIVGALMEWHKTHFTENAFNKEAFLDFFFADDPGEKEVVAKRIKNLTEERCVAELADYVNRELARKPAGIRNLANSVATVQARGTSALIELTGHSLLNEDGQFNKDYFKRCTERKDEDCEVYPSLAYIDKSRRLQSPKGAFDTLIKVMEELRGVDLQQDGALLDYLSNPPSADARSILAPIMQEPGESLSLSQRISAFRSGGQSAEHRFNTGDEGTNAGRIEALKSVIQAYTGTDITTDNGKAAFVKNLNDDQIDALGKLGQDLLPLRTFHSADEKADLSTSVIQKEAKDRVILNNQKSLGQFVDFLLLIDPPSALFVGRFTTWLYNRRVDNAIKTLESAPHKLEEILDRAADPAIREAGPLAYFEHLQERSSLSRQERKDMKAMDKIFKKSAKASATVYKRVNDLHKKREKDGLSTKEETILQRAEPFYATQAEAGMLADAGVGSVEQLQKMLNTRHQGTDMNIMQRESDMAAAQQSGLSEENTAATQSSLQEQLRSQQSKNKEALDKLIDISSQPVSPAPSVLPNAG